ncbi:MAG: DNA polymerase III subunit beta [Patescibacteria group bacterium]
MKFTSLKENLKQGLSIVGHLTTKNINLPILNNILFKVKKEGIELISTNLEISISHFLRSKIESEGEFIVDSKIISEYINLLPDDKIDFEVLNDSLVVSCKNHKTKINTQESKDFPIIPKVKSENKFIVDVLDLKKGLSSVIFSVSNNENRIEISGVLFSFLNKKLTIVGTDSYRLAERVVDFNGDQVDEVKNIIIPSKTIQEVVRILNNFKEDESLDDLKNIEIYTNENQISFVFGSTVLISRLILGNYPDYKQIIPEKEKISLKINKAEITKALKVAGIFSKTGINDVGISVKDKKVSVFSSSSNVGENSINVNSDTLGGDVEIFVNYKYVLEGLNNISSESVSLIFNDNNSPCKIYSEDEPNFLYIVMPIRQ